MRKPPWHISEHRSGRDMLIYDDDGFEVAKVCYPQRDEHATAIAALPDVLSALIALTAVARRYLPDYDEHPEIQRADEAIAKATDTTK
jgi:hypothetical protein